MTGLEEVNRALTAPDLPVAVRLAAPLAAEVVAYVEGEAGWQVVGLEGPPRPVLVLADAPVPGRATVVVVEGEPDAAQVRAALQAGALDVVSWPSQREDIVAAAARATVRPEALAGPPLLRVAGASGGAGTSTVTLAIAGLLAWAGRRVVVVGADDLLVLAGFGAWRGPGAPEIAQLDSRDVALEVGMLARQIPGVRGLCVLGGGAVTVASPGSSPVSGWPADVVVADLGVIADVGVVADAGMVAEVGAVADVGVAAEAGCDLCCARPDAHLSRIAGCRAPVVIVGEGPLGPRAVRRVLGRAPVAWLPPSARVARAGVRGRVPADLPGTWLAALSAALPAVRLARQR